MDEFYLLLLVMERIFINYKIIYYINEKGGRKASAISLTTIDLINPKSIC